MFKVYSSSAGSGKTYTLTKEYLKLALGNSSPTYFRHILAVTFTNAAATEMKERILSMLRAFSNENPETTHPMLRDIVVELYPDTADDQELFGKGCELIGERAKLVFGQILHRYSDFSVMTIDKFTQRLISSFTDELGIPFVFETKLDNDLLDEAVDHLLARIGQEGEEVLTEIVEKYYRENAEEGKSWGALPFQIKNTAQTLLNETSYLRMKNVEGLEMQDWIKIRANMREFVKEKESLVTRHASNALDLISTTFLSEKDFHQGGRGIYGYFRDRADSKKLWAEPNSYVYKTIGENVWYGGKTPALIRDEIEKVRTDLENYFHQIENVRLADTQKVTLYRLLDRYIYHLSLLGEIRKGFDSLLRQNNQVHISDFNRKIVEIVAREPVPFIFERLGDKYNHILVDEFQDTSKLQFANLLPLIENALSGGHFNLIVGDAKQSIYRFRGGDMDLILHLAQNQAMALAQLLGDNVFHEERLGSLHYNLEVNHLKINRRSCREITDFNNRFFGFIAETLGTDYPLIKAVYDQNFQQEIPEGTRSGGHVEIEFLETAESDDAEDGQAFDLMIRRVQEMITHLRNEGYGWRDMAVLSRKKADATAMANVFKDAGIPLISDDALALSYSRSVHFVISFMKVLLNSDNQLARYEAAYLYHHVIKGESPGPDEYERIRKLCEEKGLESFLAYFRLWNVQFTSLRLRQLSVFELSELLMQRFGLLERQLDCEYLFRFLDVVLDFSNKGSNHLGDFLTYWENSKHRFSITIPDDTDAVRITTIHKSKGLEYPVVIVPYAQWKVSPNARLDQLWLDMDQIDYPELTANPQLPDYKKLRSSLVPMVKELENTVVAGQYYEEKMRTLTENLNLLYVAFTRPVQRLYVLTKREKNWESGSQINHWLRDYLRQEHVVPAWSEELSVYTISKGITFSQQTGHQNKTQTLYLDRILSTDRTDSLRLRRMADRIFDIETFEPRHDRIQKAKYLLSRLRTIAELPITLNKLITEGIFTKKESVDIQHFLQPLLDNPEIGQVFKSQQRVQINKELLIPGGKLFHIDRVSEDEDRTTTFTSFVTKGDYYESKRHMKMLVKAFRLTGKTPKALLIHLTEARVEWV